MNELLLGFAAMWCALILLWYAMGAITWAVDAWHKRRG